MPPKPEKKDAALKVSEKNTDCLIPKLLPPRKNIYDSTW
jgi:hypothetical protein